MNCIKKLILKTLLRSIGKTYDATGLSKKNAHNTPILLFSEWFRQSLKEAPDQVNTMTLSTVSKEGVPSSRLVLLKHFDEQGFVFYTNYTSRKARELADNPRASLNFWWESFFRQVRIEGSAAKISAKESDRYFQSRDRESQLGAWASPQSQVIESREILEQKVEALKAQYQGNEVPRPPHWGGYRIVPDKIEFWQGRLNRLHDRFLYTRKVDGSWQRDRLAP
jgi:pyridoxamine 5'-phosphate oxidase